MVSNKKNALRDYRCGQCNKLLFKGELLRGLVEVKCKSCKNFNEFDGNAKGITNRLIFQEAKN